MTLNETIKKLQQLRKAVPGDSEIRLHEYDNVIECGDFILDINKGKIKNESYCCYRCLKDPKMLSKDKTHRLCGKLACEVSIQECETIRKGEK